MNWTIIHLLERMNFSDNENKNCDFNEFIDTKNIKRVYSVLGGFFMAEMHNWGHLWN